MLGNIRVYIIKLPITKDKYCFLKVLLQCVYVCVNSITCLRPLAASFPCVLRSPSISTQHNVTYSPC